MLINLGFWLMVICLFFAPVSISFIKVKIPQIKCSKTEIGKRLKIIVTFLYENEIELFKNTSLIENYYLYFNKLNILNSIKIGAKTPKDIETFHEECVDELINVVSTLDYDKNIIDNETYLGRIHSRICSDVEIKTYLCREIREMKKIEEIDNKIQECREKQRYRERQKFIEARELIEIYKKDFNCEYREDLRCEYKEEIRHVYEDSVKYKAYKERYLLESWLLQMFYLAIKTEKSEISQKQYETYTLIKNAVEKIKNDELNLKKEENEKLFKAFQYENDKFNDWVKKIY